MEKFDVTVLGLGAMGSAASYHLAKRNLNVLGLEQFTCAHARGSSHGHTRLIRKAYFEHPDYVPLIQSSYDLWRELEQETKNSLLKEVGLVTFGDPQSRVITGVQRSAEKYQIPLTPVQKKDFPELKIPPSFVGLMEPGAGFLRVEKAIESHCQAARQRGAMLSFEEPVLGWSQKKDGIEIQTEKRRVISKHLVITAGAWISQMVSALRPHLKVRRVPQFWFEAPNYLKLPSAFPCFAFDLPAGFFYCFPDAGDGRIKIARHTPLEPVEDPAKVDRDIHSSDLLPIQEFIREHLPGINYRPAAASVCMYTMSPDEHFIIDRLPTPLASRTNVVFAAGFSGHGFKFSPVIGEILAEIVVNGKTSHPINFLRLNRL